MLVTKKLLNVILLALLASSSLSACIHPKIKFQKAKLLDPTMDPGRTSGLYSGILSGEPMIGIEHGSSGSEGSLGASCPTCGG